MKKALEVQIEKLKAILYAHGIDADGGQLVTNGHHHHPHNHNHGHHHHAQHEKSSFQRSISDLPPTFSGESQ